MTPFPWWVRLIATLTGRTPTQVAWRLEQGAPGESDGDGQPRRKFGAVWSLVRDALPAPIAQAPATAILGLTILIVFAAMVLTTGDIAAFSSYTLRHWGATNGVLIGAGEWWRVVTSCFVHHDILHLGFNVYALLFAGRQCEHLFGSSRIFAAFVLMGAASMAVSHVWYTDFQHNPMMTSGGASGAISGLIGLALVGGHRLGTSTGIAIRDAMFRWTIYMVVFGFVVDFVNNAAHLGGFVAGVGLGAVLPLAIHRTRHSRGAAVAAAAVIIGAFGFCIAAQLGHPARYAEYPRFVFGKQLSGDTNFYRNVSLDAVAGRCQYPGVDLDRLHDAISACEELVYIDPARFGPVWSILVELYDAAGRSDDAARARRAVKTLEPLLGHS